MTKVVLGFGAMLGVTLGLLLPAPAHQGIHKPHLIVPGAAATQ
jgi:hypothetical protein